MRLSASPSLLLVLAWDDADLPGRTDHAPPRPAALPLLRALATQQPLLAVLPHLPDGIKATPGTDLPELLATVVPDSNSQAAEPVSSALEALFETAELPKTTPTGAPGAGNSSFEALAKPALPIAAMPGEVLLAAPGETDLPATPAGYQSRLLGIAETLPAALTPVLPPAPASVATAGPASPAPAVSLRLSLSQQAARLPLREPAAPYQGHGEATAFRPLASLAAIVPSLATTAAAPAASGQAAARLAPPLPTAPASHKPVPDDLADELTGLAFDPDPELPLYAGADESIPSEETGPAEAAALDAASAPALSEPETAAPAASPLPLPLPTAPARASLAQGLAALGPPPPAGTIPFALADDLHYRIIQFARFAGPLVEAQGQEFGAIYAPDWPTWLAALELRYRLRCPLVLHLTALAADQPAPASRGWLLEMERYALRRAQLILVPTEALRERVLAHYPQVEKVAVVAPDDAAGISKAITDSAPIF